MNEWNSAIHSIFIIIRTSYDKKKIIIKTFYTTSYFFRPRVRFSSVPTRPNSFCPPTKYWKYSKISNAFKRFKNYRNVLKRARTSIPWKCQVSTISVITELQRNGKNSKIMNLIIVVNFHVYPTRLKMLSVNAPPLKNIGSEISGRKAVQEQ